MRLLSSLLLMVVALVMAPKLAAAAYRPPPIAGHVTDTAGKLSPEEIAALNTKLADYRKCSGNHIAVFFARSLEGQTIEDVAYGTFNTWKIGEAGKDNGVLLVLAPNERRIRIETGKGVGGDLTDIESSHIIRDEVTPSMKAERFFEAADKGTTAIGRALGGCAMGSATVAAPADGARRKAPATPAPPIARAPSAYSEERAAMAAGIGLLVLLAALGLGARFASLIVGGVAAFFMFVGSFLFGRKGFGEGVDLDAITGVFGVLALILVILNIAVWVARAQKGFWTFLKPSSSGGSSGSFGSSSSFSSTSHDTSSWSSSSSSSSFSSSSSDYSGGGGSSGGGGASGGY